jgi:hypothetical protein
MCNTTAKACKTDRFSKWSIYASQACFRGDVALILFLQMSRESMAPSP